MRFFSLIFVFVLLINDIHAHGPSRQKVVQKIELDASPEEVWKVISDFTKFSFNKDVTSVSSSGKEVGSKRELIFSDKKKISHSLEKFDETKRKITWRIIETDNDILPVNSYSAMLMVTEKKGVKNKSVLMYKAAFYRGFMGNDPPENLNDENSKKKVISFVKKNISGIKSIVEK